MLTDEELPPIPPHPELHVMTWSKLEQASIRQAQRDAIAAYVSLYPANGAIPECMRDRRALAKSCEMLFDDHARAITTVFAPERCGDSTIDTEYRRSFLRLLNLLGGL